MIHVLKGEWAILGQDMLLDCKPLYDMLKRKGCVPQEVCMTEVSHKPTTALDPRRYSMANIEQPCLLCKGMDNPHNKPYRMLDGRHRLLKRQIGGLTTVLCYVVGFDDASKFLRLNPNRGINQ